MMNPRKVKVVDRKTRTLDNIHEWLESHKRFAEFENKNRKPYKEYQKLSGLSYATPFEEIQATLVATNHSGLSNFCCELCEKDQDVMVEFGDYEPHESDSYFICEQCISTSLQLLLSFTKPAGKTFTYRA